MKKQSWSYQFLLHATFLLARLVELEHSFFLWQKHIETLFYSDRDRTTWSKVPPVKLVTKNPHNLISCPNTHSLELSKYFHGQINWYNNCCKNSLVWSLWLHLYSISGWRWCNVQSTTLSIFALHKAQIQLFLGIGNLKMLSLAISIR